MSGLTGYRPVPVRRVGGPMPGPMVFAVVCGVGVAILWVCAALFLLSVASSSSAPLGGALPMASVAAAAGVVGVIGCLRRWVWVRWAALVQAIAVSVVLFGLIGPAPFVPWAVGLFVAYAGLQFPPSSHRWYHPKPPVPASPVPVPGAHS